MPQLLPSLKFYVIAAIAIGVLQLIPIVGVFLMFVGAPLWIGLLFHLAMGHVVFAAVTGQVSRSWLALPCAAYGVLMTAALLSHLEASRLDAESREHNAAISQLVDLLQPLAFSDGGLAGAIVTRFDVPIVFNMRYDGPMSIAVESGGICDVRYNSADLDLSFEEDLRTRGLCRVSRRATPPYGIAQIEARRRNVSGTWNTASLIEIELPEDIAGGDVDSRTVKLGYTEVYSYVPWLIAGCGLNSSPPAWDCGIRLGRSFRWLGVPDDASVDKMTSDSDFQAIVLGHALGLRPRFQ